MKMFLFVQVYLMQLLSLDETIYRIEETINYSMALIGLEGDEDIKTRNYWNY